MAQKVPREFNMEQEQMANTHKFLTFGGHLNGMVQKLTKNSHVQDGLPNTITNTLHFQMSEKIIADGGHELHKYNNE